MFDDDNIYIVAYYDSDIEQNERCEYGNFKHAKSHYDTIKGQEGVHNIRIIAYNVITKKEKIIL